MQRNGSFEANVKVGDCVGVELESTARGESRLTEWAAGEICELWWDESDEAPWCEIRWFYSMGEVPKQCRPKKTEGMELVETEHFDTIPTESIMGNIDVDGGMYFTRYLYKPQTKSLVPIEAKGRSRRCAQFLAAVKSSHRGRKRPLAQVAAEREKPSGLDRCISALQLRRAPPSLPRREKEREQIMAFVRESLVSRSGRSIYVSGMPGTGKTATVYEVVRRCQADVSLPRFNFVEINAMRLPRPSHAYVLLWQAVTDGELRPPDQAARLLDKTFGAREQADDEADDDDLSSSASSCSEEKGRLIVALVDELDWLLTKDQTVLYNLFEWPCRAGARLAVIGVANTMDLPERLEPKVRSRLGSCRLVFNPYTIEDVQAIIADRLGDDQETCFEINAIEMAARKVAAYSGDIRRALQLCTTAAEVCLQRQATKVQISDILTAYRRLSESGCLTAVKSASATERLILVAICAELTSQSANSDESLCFEQLNARLDRIFTLHNACHVKCKPDHARQLIVLARLHDARLVTLHFLDRRHRFPHINLNFHARAVADTLLQSKDPIATAVLGPS